MNVAITLVKESEDELIVRYAEKNTRGNPLLSNGLVLRRSALPDPPPALVHATLVWEQDAAATDAGRTSARHASPQVVSPWQDEVKAGDHLTIVKSRSAGVRSPPEWLEQYVGRTGIVLWTTTDGAMVDLKTDTAWFSYEELEHRD